MSENLNKKAQKRYDLEERTTRFGEVVVKLCGEIRRTHITEPILKQLIRSSMSIGANYREANGASSKKDFANKIYITRKESQETDHTLRLLAAAVPDRENDIRVLRNECHEFCLIFNKVSYTLRNGKNKSIANSHNQ